MALAGGCDTAGTDGPDDSPDPVGEVEGGMTPRQRNLVDGQEAATATLAGLHDSSRGRDLKLRYDGINGMPSFIRCDVALEGASDEDRARELLRRTSPLFMGLDPDAELELVRITEDDLGLTHVQFAQRVDGVRVHGGVFKVHMDRTGAITSLGGGLLPGVRPEVPELDETTAVEEAVLHLQARGEAELAANAPAEMELVVFQPAFYGMSDERIHTAWSIRWDAVEVLVDALDGEVLARLDLGSTAMNRQVIDHPTGATWFQDDPWINSASCDADCQAVRTHLDTTYDYWWFQHGLDSYDGGGADLLARVHYNVKGPNAFSNGTETKFADGWTDQDIVVHEWTHAITNETSQLVYLNQSGALNEHFSDIMPMFLDDDFKFGDGIAGFTAALPLRDLSDPNMGMFDKTLANGAGNRGRPDHMDDYLLSTDTICSTSGDGDIGCVHFNNCIPSHAIYLASEGGTKNGIVVKGQGMDALEPVLWLTQTEKLTSNATFDDYVDHMLESCSEIHGLGSEVCVSIRDGLAAVGMAESENASRTAGNLGYSLLSADLNGDGTDDVVATTPHNHQDTALYTGSISIYLSDGGQVQSDPVVFTQNPFGGAVESNDYFGWDVASGDINGDGAPDLLVGAYGEDNAGYTDAGVAYYMINDGTGLGGETGYIFQSGGTYKESDDKAGYAVALGDFDCDGFDDAAIGAPEEDWGSIVDTGAVTVHYSGGDYPGAAGADVIHQSDYTSSGDETGDRFGLVLAVGDFDDDGCDDLAVGTPYEDWNSTTNSGAVYVFYGDSDGITEGHVQTWAVDWLGIGGESYIGLGSALAAGDFDGDGYDDLAMGAPSVDVGGIVDAGLVLVLDGSASKLQDNGVSFSQSPITGDENFDRTGTALAAGDVDHDGYDDLLMGVPNEDYSSTSNAGVAILRFGSDSGIGTDGATAWGYGYGEAMEAWDYFGMAVAIGDVFDGTGGLIIGVPYEDTDQGSNVGAVRLVPEDPGFDPMNLY
jgi:Zn-dependent metalloprotease